MPAWNDGDGIGRPRASRLAQLLRDNKARILQDWEQAAREQAASRRLDRPVLLDHLPDMLDRIAGVADRPLEAEGGVVLGGGPGAHTLTRIEAGFDLAQVLREYRLLRACLLRVLGESEPPPSFAELELLDGLIDSAMAQAVDTHMGVREQTLRELGRLFDTGLELLELDELLPRLLRVLSQTVPSVSLAVVLLRESTRLTVRGAAGENAELARESSVEIGEGIAGRIVAERKPLSVRFAATDPVVDRGVMRGMRALYGVPLMYGEELAGVAYMASRTAFEFAEYDKLFFRAVADRVVTHLHQRALLDRERSAREEARRTAALLDSLLAAAPLGIAFFDRELRYLRINDVLAALNARPVHEHLGRTVHEVIPGVADFLERVFRDVLATGRAVTSLEICTSPPASPNEIRWWSATYYPIRRDDGWILGIGVLMVEITGRKRAEAELKEREAHLGLLAEGVEGLAFFTVDVEGRVSSWNTGAARLFGHTAGDVVGKPLARLYAPDDAEAARQHLETATRQGRCEDAGLRLRNDGTTFRAAVAVTALRDAAGQVLGFAVLARELGRA